jgi:hypothetical protein
MVEHNQQWTERGSGLELVEVERTPLRPTPLPSALITRKTDLRLLHHFFTFTIPSLYFTEDPDIIEIWRRDVPQIAFEHDFLLDTQLALASVHLCQEAPELVSHQIVSSYVGKALRSYRKALGNLSSKNIMAVSAASMLLSPSSLVVNRCVGDTGPWVVNWLRIHAGTTMLFFIADWEEVRRSCIAPTFQVKPVASNQQQRSGLACWRCPTEQSDRSRQTVWWTTFEWSKLSDLDGDIVMVIDYPCPIPRSGNAEAPSRVDNSCLFCCLL